MLDESHKVLDRLLELGELEAGRVNSPSSFAFSSLSNCTSRTSVWPPFASMLIENLEVAVEVLGAEQLLLRVAADRIAAQLRDGVAPHDNGWPA